MSTQTYRTTCWGESHEITADFAQASSQVIGAPGGKQVADYQHSPAAAMRDVLEDQAIAGGSQLDEQAVIDEIDSAIDAMVEVGSAEDAADRGWDEIAPGIYADEHCYGDGSSTIDWYIGSDPAHADEILAALVALDMTEQESAQAVSDCTRWTAEEFLVEAAHQASCRKVRS
jgi:hypothetical protein